MNEAEFLRVEHEGSDGSRHYVLHLYDPKFMLELSPDPGAPDAMGRGVIRRLCVPNSWAGDYTKCVRLMQQAQDFFEASRAEPAAARAARRSGEGRF